MTQGKFVTLILFLCVLKWCNGQCSQANSTFVTNSTMALCLEQSFTSLGNNIMNLLLDNSFLAFISFREEIIANNPDKMNLDLIKKDECSSFYPYSVNYFYTSDNIFSYYNLNVILRDDSKIMQSNAVYKSWIKTMVKETVNSTQPYQLLYRCMYCPLPTSQNQVGDVLLFKSFTSTAFNESDAKNYGFNCYVIQSNNFGKLIQPCQASGQSEVLLFPGQQYRVVSKLYQNGSYTYQNISLIETHLAFNKGESILPSFFLMTIVLILFL
jgi:hypothetical protein